MTLKNFGTYEQATMDLSADHLVGLGGLNGRGKSWILEAIRYALFGTCRCDSTEELIRWGSAETQVSLVFRVGAETYRVTRQRNLRSKSTLQLDHQADGHWQSLTSGSIAGTEKLLRQITGLSDGTFVATSYLLQGEADLFSRKLKPQERRELLVDMLQLGLFSAVGKAAGQKANELRPQLQAHRLTLETLQMLPAEIETLEGLLADYRRRKIAAEEAAERRQEELVQAEAAFREQEGARTRLRELQRQLSALKEEASGALEQHDTRLQGALGRRERELRAAHQQVADALVERGKAARQALDQAESRAQTLQGQLTRLERRLADLPVVESGLQERLAREVEEQERLHERQRLLQAEYQQLYTAFDRVTRRREAQRQQVGQQLETERRAASRLGDDVRCLDLPKARCLFLADAHDSAERIPMLAAELLVLEQPGTEEREASALVEGASAQLREVEAQVRNLSLLRRQLEEARVTEALASTRPEIQEQLRATVLELAEIQGQLPALVEAREQLRVELLGLKETQARELRGALDHLATEGSEERTRLEAGFAERRRALRQQLEEVEPRGQQASEQLVEDARARAKETWARVQQLAQELGATAARLQRLRDQERTTPEVEAQVREVARDLSHYETLARLFHPKTGCQLELIRQIIPELEARANHLLGRLTGGEMQLELITERDNRSRDGQQQVIEIVIRYEGRSLSYQACSGGQQFRINFALRLALSHLLAARSGARLEMLAIDEGLGSQDPEGRDALLEALELVRADFSLIILVSHIDDVLSRLPARIEVYREGPGQGSKIRRRVA